LIAHFYGGLAGALIPDGDKWDPPSLTGGCGGDLPDFTATFRAAGSIVEPIRTKDFFLPLSTGP
jgi:hypothetical protein